MNIKELADNKLNKRSKLGIVNAEERRLAENDSSLKIQLHFVKARRKAFWGFLLPVPRF